MATETPQVEMHTLTHTPMMSKDTQGTNKVRSSTGSKQDFCKEKAGLTTWGQDRTAKHFSAEPFLAKISAFLF